MHEQENIRDGRKKKKLKKIKKIKIKIKTHYF
jgi:hypothetical protein